MGVWRHGGRVGCAITLTVIGMLSARRGEATAAKLGEPGKPLLLAQTSDARHGVPPSEARRLGRTRPAPAQPNEVPAEFGQYLESIWPLARARGVSRETFEAAFSGVGPDPSLPAISGRQPEFGKPIQSYIDEAVSLGRVQRGRDEASRWRPQLGDIQESYGVPGDILLAIWGMETDFGRYRGDRYVIRSLVTLAAQRPLERSYLDELIDALVMLEKGAATRATLRGSWAGAMGYPQFLPSTYLKYAVSYDGAGAADIWASVPDTLASIANFLKMSGWQPGLIWGTEVFVPKTFDYQSLRESFATWSTLGFRAANGGKLAALGDATLFLPAGAGGPAFLLSENYWVIKQYNNSDSYALSVASLSDRISGKPAIQGSWPINARLLTGSERVRVQQLLGSLGFYRGEVDGRIGPATRDAVHEFQVSVGYSPADGYASPALLDRLLRASAKPPR